jgi:hypothetical protein
MDHLGELEYVTIDYLVRESYVLWNSLNGIGKELHSSFEYDEAFMWEVPQITFEAEYCSNVLERTT